MPRYKTRDPRPVNRDPGPEPETAQLPNADRPAMLVSEPPRPQVKCARCGGVKFCNTNNTRPSLACDKMTRRRQCCKCGQWHVMQSEPTAEERARYWRK